MSFTTPVERVEIIGHWIESISGTVECYLTFMVDELADMLDPDIWPMTKEEMNAYFGNSSHTPDEVKSLKATFFHQAGAVTIMQDMVCFQPYIDWAESSGAMGGSPDDARKLLRYVNRSIRHLTCFSRVLSSCLAERRLWLYNNAKDFWCEYRNTCVAPILYQISAKKPEADITQLLHALDEHIAEGQKAEPVSDEQHAGDLGINFSLQFCPYPTDEDDAAIMDQIESYLQDPR